MLTEIFIRNYLFVPEQRLKFGPGLTVLSGETGAGKSILVGSISLIFGENPPGLEAYEPDQAIYLESSFDPAGNAELLDFLAAQGHQFDGELTLAREISPEGRSTYYLNGRRASASLLKDLKPLIIDFHHQRDQQRLLSNAYQLRLLDLYAQNSALRESFAAGYRKLRQDLKGLAALKAEEESHRQFSELYQYQFDELEKAAVREGEDAELQQEFDSLSHAREIGETAATVAFDLYERENSVHSLLRQAAASLGRYASLNPKIGQAEQSLRDCLEIVSDCAGNLGDLGDGAAADPARLTRIQERLDEINGLLYKHRVKNIGELLELFAQRRAQINAFADLGERIRELGAATEAAFSRLRETGDELSQSRLRAAKKLCAELRLNIRELSIPDARFEIVIDKNTQSENTISEYLDLCSENGGDDCQFRFSANRGSDLKPLSAVASGGELSRILLAIKKVLADRIEAKLIILDEIDAGIGGKTAERVAEFISSLASRHRILCITHLAQIAAIADQHIALDKTGGKKKNIIRMTPLQRPQRLAEIARMLSGNSSGISLKHAEELINKYNARG